MTTNAKHPRTRNSLFRALVALEACRPGADADRIAARHGVESAQVKAWRRRLTRSTVRWPLRAGQEWWF
ncbi:MAG TPA: hypothetical protein VK196_18820 [Magnetospirillum sp.]|nr:hypothetical protein [Magnetospirillum sp.]